MQRQRGIIDGWTLHNSFCISANKVQQYTHTRTSNTLLSELPIFITSLSLMMLLSKNWFPLGLPSDPSMGVSLPW